MTKDDQLVYCYNTGCGQKYDPSTNDETSCLFHSGVPKFHDAYKIWTCCDRKSVDFSTFLAYPGCTKGKHSSEKVDNTIRLVPQTEIRPEKEDEVIAWNGLNEPDERPSADTKFTSLTKVPSVALKNAITRFMEENVDKALNELTIGTTCKNLRCGKAYTGPESNAETCLHHPGIEIFHDGMKYYSCCNVKTSDFDSFLKQVGCEKTKHCWFKEEKNAKVKQDWFSSPGLIHVNLYCKNALPDKCSFESNGYELRATVSHGFGEKETSVIHHLFGQIDPSQSKVNIGERKVEIVLKQVTQSNWPRLNYGLNQEESTA